MSRFRMAAAVVCALVLAGCGDSAGPDEFNMTQMRSDLDLGFDDEPSADNEIVFEGLQESGDVLGAGMAVPLSRAGWAAGTAPVFSRAGEPLSFSRRELPDSVMGSTFEFDDVAGEYVSSARTGAPADGARFILYQVDASGDFASPLVEVGHLDFRELGDAERREGRVVAVVDDATLYDVSGYATGTAGSGTFGAEGFIIFNGLRIEFEGSGTSQPSAGGSTATMAVTLTLPQRDVDIQGTLSAPDGAGTQVTMTASASSAAGQLDIAGTAGDNGSGDYTTESTFSLNGEEFATRTEVQGEPVVFAPLNGHTVTAEHEAFFTEVENLPQTAALTVGELLFMMQPMLAPMPLAF